MSNSLQLKSEMIRFCARMDQQGFVANHDGNISVKLTNGHFLITPTARFKGDLKADDLIEVDSKGKKISGAGESFSELALHLKVYAARADVAAVVHSHAPHATAVGSANQEMTTGAIPEAVVSLGPGVPLVGLDLPGSPALLSEFENLLAHYDTVMVAGNGIFSWGKNLEQAYLRMELVEHLAKILLASLPLGGPQLLHPEQIRELLKRREKAGLARPADPARPHWF